MTVDHRTIVNAALARIGASPLGSLTAETAKARQVSAVYYDTIDALLAKDWSFNGKTYALDAVPADAAHDYVAADATYKTGWRYAFYLPGDRLSLPRRVLTDPRRPDDPLRDFLIEQDVLYADRTPLWAAVSVRADPAAWPAEFRLAAIVAAAAALCVPMSHDKDLAEALRGEAFGSPQEGGAGGLFGRALTADQGRARTKAPNWRDPLTEARWM